MNVKLQWTPADQPSFCGFPRCLDLSELAAKVAVIGIPYKSPYGVSTPLPGPTGVGECSGGPIPVGTTAAAALRRQSQAYAHRRRHYDFDFDGDLLAGQDIRVVDCGDLVLDPARIPDPARHEEGLRTVTAAVRGILERQAVPVVLGGDHGTLSPILQAFEGRLQARLQQPDASGSGDAVGGVHGADRPARRG